MTTGTGLEIRDLQVAYRGVPALHGVSLTVPPGEVVTLLGSNGAGKTTVLRAISNTLGLHRAKVTGGTITWRGESLERRSSAAIVRSGITHVPEGRRVFARMTVEDNLWAGSAPRPRREAHERFDEVYALFPVLKERTRQYAGLLSGGEQQMLAIGRALMGAPELLLLDEPSLGLAPRIIEQVGRAIVDIAALGISVMLVEQNAALALGLSQQAYVLELGRSTISGPSAELRTSDRVRELYLGSAATHSPTTRASSSVLTKWQEAS